MSTTAEVIEAISHDQRLVLRAALMDGPPARRAWEEWRARVDIDVVDGPSMRLLPLLARRLDGQVPDDQVWKLVKGVYRHAWVANQLLVRDAAAIVDTLRARDVPVIILKGASMLRYLGGDWGARPMYDVDILVRPAKLEDAIAALNEGGWVPQGDHSVPWLRWRAVSRRHSWGFDRDPDGHLDLHWHALFGSIGETADDLFWADAEPLSLGPTTALALAPHDLLVHVLEHGTLGEDASPVQWVADATHVLRGVDVSALSVEVGRRARAHGVLEQVRACLRSITELVEEPAAGALLDRLGPLKPSRVERLSDPVPAPRGRLRTALHHGARTVRRFGGRRASVLRATRGFARSWLDLDLSRHRGFTVLYAATGRSPALATIGRRMFGTFVRTPTPQRSVVEPGATLNFADPTIGDRHAGPGWYAVHEGGIDSIGRESRVVFDLAAPSDLAITLDLVPLGPRPCGLEVAVNERVLVTTTLDPHDPAPLVVQVPARVVRRGQPIEIAIRTPQQPLRRGLPRRSSLAITLRHMQVEARTTDASFAAR